MAANAVASIYKVSLDGTDFGTKTATCEPGGVRKTSQYASGKRTGSSREPIGTRITVTYEMVADTDVEYMRNFTGNVTYENDVGHVFQVSNAEVMEPPSIAPNGGGISLVIEGDPAVLV